MKDAIWGPAPFRQRLEILAMELAPALPLRISGGPLAPRGKSFFFFFNRRGRLSRGNSPGHPFLCDSPASRPPPEPTVSSLTLSLFSPSVCVWSPLYLGLWFSSVLLFRTDGSPFCWVPKAGKGSRAIASHKVPFHLLPAVSASSPLDDTAPL